MKPRKQKALTSRSSSLDRQNTSKKSSPTGFSIDVLSLKVNNKELSQNVVDLRQENACLKTTIDILRREKFEIESKYNSLKNAFSSMDTHLRGSLNQINGLTDNLSNVMKIQQYVNTLNSAYGNYGNASASKRDSPHGKTHIIKPHMVNGHILHVPTIKVTRISESNILQHIGQTQVERRNENTNEVNQGALDDSQGNGSFICRSDSNFMSSTAHIESMDMSELEESVINNNEELMHNEEDEEENNDSNQRLRTIEEVTENSSQRLSQSGNSTVLSGVFQDVKIYLNQLPQGYMEMHTDKNKTRNSNENASPSYVNVCRPSTSEVENHNFKSRQSRPIICGFPSTSRIDTSCNDDANDFSTMCFNDSLEVSQSDVSRTFNGDHSSLQTSTESRTSVKQTSSKRRESFVPTPSTSRESLEKENSDDDLNSSKLVIMKELGLAPIQLANKTSTPLVPSTNSCLNVRPSISLTPIAHRRPKVSERHPKVSQRHRNVSERHPKVSEQNPNISERHPNITERHPNVSERHQPQENLNKELKRIQNSSGFRTDTSLEELMSQDCRVTRRNRSNQRSSLKKRSLSKSPIKKPSVLNSPSIRRSSLLNSKSPRRVVFSPTKIINNNKKVRAKRSVSEGKTSAQSPGENNVASKASPSGSPKKRGRPTRAVKPVSFKEQSLRKKLRR